MKQETRKLNIDGMTCTSCELRIESMLKKTKGVLDAKVSFNQASATVTYDSEIVSIEKIIENIEKLDYTVRNKTVKNIVTNGKASQKTDKISINQLIGIGIILFAGYLLIKNTIGFNFIPNVTQNMGLGILFVIGMITSLHCVAMCGGINLSQCVSYQFDENEKSKFSKLKPSLLYNLGRVISYTIVGGVVGALGSVVSFSGTAKGIVAILSGIFMLIMGLNMLNIFPWLRKLTPRMPKVFGKKIYGNGGKRGPFYVGLLNGLMPCGPLQAMQIYALGTGSFLLGAASMFMFSLGTVPLMFGFGAISSFLSGKFTHKMMKVSAVLVMVLGVIMMNRGFALSGFNLIGGITASASSITGNVAKIEDGVQVITTTLEPNRYTPFIVQKGIPVKWTIQADASTINGCNGTVTIPKYNISKTLQPGDNEIDFTPDETGNIAYTCWMGMISSNIQVVDDLSNVSESDLTANDNTAGSGLLSGCCGTTPAQFANGKIPTDDIQLAEVKDGQQTVTVTVNNNGYSPAVVVLQKGTPAIIKFNAEQLNGCNSTVVFPEYQGQLDLSNQTETPLLTPEQDFTFQCGMNMLHGYVKVVDDLSKVKLGDIRKEVQDYTPPAGTGAGGCCG